MEESGFNLIWFLAVPIGGLISVLMAWGAGELARLIRAKVKNEYARGVLDRLTIAVSSAVQSVNQTFVDAVKSGNEDGKLTDLEKRSAKNKAINAAKSYIGPKGLRELAKIAGGKKVDEMIETAVEAQVGEEKKYK